MYYYLDKRYALRGWDDLPYALVDLSAGNIAVINETFFDTLSLCNGQVNSAILLPSHLSIIKKLMENGIVNISKNPVEIHKFQKYKKADCIHVYSVHWSITGLCNLKCRHCYMSAPQGKFGELSTEQCFTFINQLVDANITSVSLTGGEPLIRKDFWLIVDCLLKNNIHISYISTNGVLVDEEMIDSFKGRNIMPGFTISYDGIGTHDWLRGVGGSEKKALDAMRLLIKNGLSVSIEMSLNKQNIHTLSESVFLLATIGVKSIKITPTSNSGNWLNETDYTLTIPDLYDAYLSFIDAYKNAGAPVDVMLGGFFACKKGSTDYKYPSCKYDGSEAMLNKPICGSARYNIYVGADGKVLPCIPLSGLPIQESMPSVLEMPLSKILSDSKLIDTVSLTLGEFLSVNKECDSCEYKLYCGGGCRAGALICGNSFYGKDDSTCLFFKSDYRDKVNSIYTT